jgi:tRNA1Val (adenine37-N6)-methyltransferase
MRSRPPGWNPPGLEPPGDGGDPSLRPLPGETLDCLSGHWKIFQLARGHRYSTDDVLAAWYAVQALDGARELPLRHLDLGCGVYSIGLLLLWQLPRLTSIGVEAQAQSVRLARRSIRYNGLGGRAAVYRGDLREPCILEGAEPFQLVTGSPPYLTRGEGRRSTAPQRGPCRFEDRGGSADYLAAARRHLAPGGVVAWCHATRYAEANLEAAACSGLGGLRWRPVVFREGKASLISLFAGSSAGGAGVVEEPPLVIRRADETVSEEFRRIRVSMGFPPGGPKPFPQGTAKSPPPLPAESEASAESFS